MKFKIFGIYEVVYKIATYLIVTCVTIAAIYYYFYTKDKNNTFIVATLYATFLFIVGIYLSNMEKKIENKIYERINAYVNLCRVKNLLDDDISTTHSIKIAIITFKVLSGRADDISLEKRKKAFCQKMDFDYLMNTPAQHQRPQNAMPNFINEEGFVFTENINNIENAYMNLESELNKELTDSINEYLKRSEIKADVLTFSELDFLDTNYDEWCDTHIVGTDKQIEAVKNFIYTKIESLYERICLLNIKRKKVEKYYKKCLQKTNKNIKRLEAIYSNKLHYIIDSDNITIQTSNEIKEYLDTIYREQENLYQLDDITNAIRECEQTVDNIYSKISNTEENIMAAISVLQEDIDKIK